MKWTVEDHLMSFADLRDATLVAVARDFGVNRSTIQLRLAQEGTSFNRLRAAEKERRKEIDRQKKTLRVREGIK